MSVDDLVKEEIQRQVDTSIEEIPHEVSLWNTPDNKERFQYENISDFMLGYEYGHIAGISTGYAIVQLNRTGRTFTDEEAREIGKKIAIDIKSILFDRLPEIRYAIQRAVT
jgi:hypothetical protein